MRNVEPLVVKLRREDLVKEFSRAIRYELTESEQEELIEDLMSHLEEPPGRVSGFAELVTMLEENGGHLDATEEQCWKMARETPAR